MANALLAHGNRIESATLSGGSWLPAMPLTNLQDRRLGYLARSSSPAAAHTKFDVDFGGTRLFRVIALVNHNLSSTATYRIRLGLDPTFATTAGDSGTRDVWPVLFPFGTVPWGSPSWWTGRISAEEASSYTGTLVFILPQSTNARYIRVEITDESNVDGYVQVGRMFAADAWQPTRNMVYGASIGWEPRTEVQAALSGAEYFNEKPSIRVVKFELPAMTEDEAMALAFELQRSAGTSKEVLFVWDPDDTFHAVRRQFLGRLSTLSLIENSGINRWKTPFEIQELL